MCCFFDTKTRNRSFLYAPTERQVSVYFGLVPRQYQSGETDRNGRITKRGNPLARTILVECAWAMLLEAAYGLSVSVVEKE